jgi:calcium/calmodulin-dependent protein kinase I
LKRTISARRKQQKHSGPSSMLSNIATKWVSLIEILKYIHLFFIIKPENLLFSSKSPGALLKISDFGLARFIQSNEVMMTQCGTPGYVAPEIILGKGYNEAIDFWSLGVILYIMFKNQNISITPRLCGFPPFYDEDNDKLFQLIKTGTFTFPSPYWDSISNEGYL